MSIRLETPVILTDVSLTEHPAMRLERISHELAACACSAFEALRTRHQPREFLARHQHATAYAALVLSGTYEEAGDSGRHRVSAGDVILHAPFEHHLDRFDNCAAEVINLPLCYDWTGPVLARVNDPDSIARVAERNVSEGARLLGQSLVARPAKAEDWPDQLAADLLEDPELSLGAWASQFSLHPGSLARGFRQQFAITPAEFRLLARARKALRYLSDLPLGEVAAASGFADQAHMSRTLKRVTGSAPGELQRQFVLDACGVT